MRARNASKGRRCRWLSSEGKQPPYQALLWHYADPSCWIDLFPASRCHDIQASEPRKTLSWGLRVSSVAVAFYVSVQISWRRMLCTTRSHPSRRGNRLNDSRTAGGKSLPPCGTLPCVAVRQSDFRSRLGVLPHAFLPIWHILFWPIRLKQLLWNGEQCATRLARRGNKGGSIRYASHRWKVRYE